MTLGKPQVSVQMHGQQPLHCTFNFGSQSALADFCVNFTNLIFSSYYWCVGSKLKLDVRCPLTSLMLPSVDSLMQM